MKKSIQMQGSMDVYIQMSKDVPNRSCTNIIVITPLKYTIGESKKMNGGIPMMYTIRGSNK